MGIHRMEGTARGAFAFLALACLSACAESTPEFRRNVEIRTDGPPAQCVLAGPGNRSAEAIASTPGTVLVPYTVKTATVECQNKHGWHGSTVADLPDLRQAQVVVVHMHK